VWASLAGSMHDHKREGTTDAPADEATASVEAPKSRPKDIVYPVALMGSLCIWLLAVRAPLWLDETLCYWQISAGFSKIWSRSAAMPSSFAYLYILWAAKAILGSKEIAFRIPSILAMLGAAYALFRAARELLNQEVAYIACILFCLHLDVVFAAIDVRPYAFGLLATNVAILALVRWTTRNSIGYAILFGTAAGAILHFHYLFGSVLPAFAAYYLVLRSRSIRSDASQLAAMFVAFGLISLPLLPRFLNLFQSRQIHTFAGAPATFVLLRTLVPFKMLVGFVLATFLAALLRRLRLPASVSSPAFLLGPLLAATPIAILYGLSAATSTHVFIPRYCLVAVPGSALTWGWLVTWIDARWLRQIFAAGLVGVTGFLSLASAYSGAHELSFKRAFESVNANVAQDKATVLLTSAFIESDYWPLPPQTTESPLFSQTSYYRLDAPTVLLPIDLTDESKRIASQSIWDAAQSQRRFLLVAGPESYETVNWIANCTRGAFAPSTVGDFDQIVVVEFTPIGN
jgi:hypothetical protein